MHFEKKKFKSLRGLVLSEKPLFAMQFEERVAALIPAMEVSIDSFEDYHSAYEHCAKIRTVGVFFYHHSLDSKLPENALDELAAPYEEIDSTAGLYVIASDEKAFAAAYKRFGSSERILGITLESELKSDAAFKESILEALSKMDRKQIDLAVPKAELEFFVKTARKHEDLDSIHRITHLLTHKLDRDWYDDLLIEAGPALLCIPENQKWILNNSPSLTQMAERLKPYAGLSAGELVSAKDTSVTARAVVCAQVIYQAQKNGTLEEELTKAVSGSSAFAPTLKKILSAEKANILAVFENSQTRKAV